MTANVINDLCPATGGMNTEPLNGSSAASIAGIRARREARRGLIGRLGSGKAGVCANSPQALARRIQKSVPYDHLGITSSPVLNRVVPIAFTVPCRTERRREKMQNYNKGRREGSGGSTAVTLLPLFIAILSLCVLLFALWLQWH